MRKVQGTEARSSLLLSPSLSFACSGEKEPIAHAERCPVTNRDRAGITEGDGARRRERERELDPPFRKLQARSSLRSAPPRKRQPRRMRGLHDVIMVQPQRERPCAATRSERIRRGRRAADERMTRRTSDPLTAPHRPPPNPPCAQPRKRCVARADLCPRQLWLRGVSDERAPGALHQGQPQRR